MANLEKQVRFLILSNIASWGLIGLFVLTGFSSQIRTRFMEIDAERVNIVGTNGKPVMVLANRRLIPGPAEIPRC